MLGGTGQRGLSQGARDGGAAAATAAAMAGGSFQVYKVRLINVVNENETKWTHFRLITHPAQVQRSGVQESMRARSKPVGLLVLINTSEDVR